MTDYSPSCIEFQAGPVNGVELVDLTFHTDERGWLLELFRQDELPPNCSPVMGYVSETKAGVTRGPHMHRTQTDHFVVMGPGEFEFCLWDDREHESTFGNRLVVRIGGNQPQRLTVPPLVIHAYRNMGTSAARLMNFPDVLYAGTHRAQPVDEIRFTDVADHPFHW